MTAPCMTWKQVLACAPCHERRDAVRTALEAKFPDYKTRCLTVSDAVTAGVGFGDLCWITCHSPDPDVRRRLRLFAADCAARVVHLAKDSRSTAAVFASRQYARGEIDAAAWAAARDAAWDAAWDAARAAARDAADAAWAAARDAAWAAAWAAARDAAWAAARDAARDAAWDAARAAARDAAWDAAWDAADAARDAEEAWQLQRFIERFSEVEPEDWPIIENAGAS